MVEGGRLYVNKNISFGCSTANLFKKYESQSVLLKVHGPVLTSLVRKPRRNEQLDENITVTNFKITPDGDLLCRVVGLYVDVECNCDFGLRQCVSIWRDQDQLILCKLRGGVSGGEIHDDLTLCVVCEPSMNRPNLPTWQFFSFVLEK